MSQPAIPDDRGYTEEHEWVSMLPGADLPDGSVRIGITSVAADSLGELVFIDLPEVGAEIVAGESCGEVESTKTVSELYPPVSGRVTEVNTAAVDDPSIVAADPYGAGWLFAVQPTSTATLLTAAEYAKKIEVAS
jgi:glycine cleavage system H protein